MEIFDVINQAWLIGQIQNNDFLIAALFTACAYVLRSIPGRVYRFIMRNITIEFDVTSEDVDYEAIVSYIEKRRFSIFSRTYSKPRKSEFRSLKNPDHDHDFSQNPRLTLGYGNSVFHYNGVIGFVQRSFKENNHSDRLKEQISITLLTRNSKNIIDLIQDSIKDSRSEFNNIPIMTLSYGSWEQQTHVPTRTFETVYIDDDIKRDLINRIDSFVRDKEKYTKKGIPYKLGIFISGNPGSGKSSVVRAIATHLKRPIYYFSSEALKSTSDGISDCRDGILVFEDFDNIRATTDREESDTKIEETATLLNMLDGPLTPDGLIFVATTNHPENVDPAIVRKGRFDIHISINSLDILTFSKMVSSLWDVSLDRVISDFVENYRVQLNGSVVQSVYFECPDYEKAKGILYEKISSSVSKA